MVRSLAVVLVLVLAIGLLALRSSGGDVKTVDYQSLLSTARASAPYDLLAPTGLDGWRATSVRYDPAESGATEATVWHIGFYTPAKRYAGVDESNGPAADFIDEITQGATTTLSTVRLGTIDWTRYEGGGDAGTDDETRALVAQSNGVTTLVSGSAEWPELEQLATSLRAS